jgi:hypothetical protein
LPYTLADQSQHHLSTLVAFIIALPVLVMTANCKIPIQDTRFRLLSREVVVSLVARTQIAAPKREDGQSFKLDGVGIHSDGQHYSRAGDIGDDR